LASAALALGIQDCEGSRPEFCLSRSRAPSNGWAIRPALTVGPTAWS
jgi:hypothetical protein